MQACLGWRPFAFFWLRMALFLAPLHCGRDTQSYPSLFCLQNCSGTRLTAIENEARAFCIGKSCSLPQWQADRDAWSLTSQGEGLQGILFDRPLSGHFSAAVKAETRDGSPRGLIAVPAVRAPSGEFVPDLSTYLAIMEDRDERGFTRIKARDRQTSPQRDGLEEQVLDRTSTLDEWEKDLRYQAHLDGSFGADDGSRNNFRVPFTESDGRLRLFHHSRSRLGSFEQAVFYLSYFVSKALPFHPAAGWMSLAPIPSWNEPDQAYFLGFAIDAERESETFTFHDYQTSIEPSHEPAAESASFRVTRKPYSWSGFPGEALQVEFGDFFAASKRYRLVFWSEMNNVPAWHINDQLLLTYSFVELWPQNRWKSPGCFEAMSDDFLWNNTVTVLADHPARKIILWRSYLLNPAYQTIAQTLGPSNPNRSLESLAHTDELWTVYPDGSAFRHITYVPDADGLGADSYEIAELSIIAGSRSRPEDHAEAGASLELWNPQNTEAYRFRPSGGRDLEGRHFQRGGAPFDRWPETVAVVKLKDGTESAPLVYAAFSQNEASARDQLMYDVSWQGYEWEFSHWPVSREPYEYHDKSLARWEAEVSHASLTSVQVKTGGRSPAAKDFTSLVGIHADPSVISSRVQSWVSPPTFSHLKGCDRPRYDRTRGDITLDWFGPQCSFQLDQKIASASLVLRITGLSSETRFKLWIDGVWQSRWAQGFEAEDASVVIYIPALSSGLHNIVLAPAP